MEYANIGGKIEIVHEMWTIKLLTIENENDKRMLGNNCQCKNISEKVLKSGKN